MHDKKTSTVYMNITSSTGAWLNGCMQPQHYFVSLEIKDPEGRVVVRAALSYEQAARMLLYNGEVDCTLERYRDIDGKIISEKVEVPETIHQRMKDRLGETQDSILKRIEDVRRDLYEMVNGDVKRNKSKIQELLNDVDVIKSHVVANRDFVVQQAEEELGKMQSNAAGQLGLFIESKLGVEAPVDVLKNLLPVSNGPLLIGSAVPINDKYELKEREEKPIDDMTALQVSDCLHKLLQKFESLERIKFECAKVKDENRRLFQCGASANRQQTVNIRYISYQHNWTVNLEEAKKYLKFLSSIKTIDEFKAHHQIGDKDE